jgi:hypothetical protein
LAEVTVTVADINVEVAVCEKDIVILDGNFGPQGPRGSQLLSGNTNPSISIGLIGDQYINTDTGYLFGPKTESGWGAGVPLGNNDPNDLGQVHYQTSPSTVWDITHTLTFIPNIIIVDLNNHVIEADINYVDDNRITVTLSHPVVGVAYLS